MSELRNCPFCNSNDLTVAGGDWEGAYFVMCHNCAAQGSRHEKRQDAIKKWNTRHIDDDLAKAYHESAIYALLEYQRKQLDLIMNGTGNGEPVGILNGLNKKSYC